ncbi:MAG: lysophospholipid acyltransferase family protein [Legionella sp.]|nr:lysophospholipid acyltransferase family protein [Legionella sp.]
MTKNKKAGPIRSLWLIIVSCLLVINTCTRAIFRSLFGKVTRPWVDRRMQIWTHQMFKLWRITCTVHNPKKTQPKLGQPTIIMCNHSSLLDIPLSYYAFPDISLRMLAKKEMSQLPIMGRAMKASGFPFIDRKNRRQAIRDLTVIHDLLESGIVMWIAPEGTRSPDRHLGPFKKGGFITAIRMNAVIIPIGLRGAWDILPARTHDCYLNQKTEVHIGEPIDASQFTLDNKEDLIHQTREAMKALAGDDSP